MDIIVLLKQTFDTEEKIVIQDGKIVEDGPEYVINPYDEYAVEAAIKLKETQGAEVTVVTLGPPRVENALRTALAMGADKAILIENESNVLDEHTLSKVLAATIKDRDYDLILAGSMSVDNGASQVAVRVAEELNMAHVATAVELTIDSEKATVVRDVEGNSEVIEATLPLLVTAQQGLNDPRYPSLPGIMKAKRKPLDELELDDLDLDEDDVEAKTKTIDIFLPPEKEAGRILEGDIADQVKELA